MSQTQSKNQNLSVHLRVYRGEKVSFGEDGKCLTENFVVKLYPYGSGMWSLFLTNAIANGFCKCTVEKVLDMSKDGAELEDVKPFQEEVDNLTGKNKAVIKTAAEEMADLKAQNAAMMKMIEDMKNGQNSAKETPKHSETVDSDAELKALRAEYTDITGEQGDKRWGIETLKEKLAELKS